MADLDCVVVGAGVVGLACAARLAGTGLDVVVLERHGGIGEETSSRNSEVIHAGIYYPTGSRKAQLCVTGKRLLYEFCVAHHVPHRACGKIIVATDASQLDVLRGYQQQAMANGVGELTWLSGDAVRELEPEVRAVAGVLSPTTGIVDSHAFMLALQGLFEAGGGMVAFETEVTDLRRNGDELVVVTSDGEISARHVVNCGGLGAPALARRLDPGAPREYFARGHYYTYHGRQPFSRLVYPVAEAGGLGVHVTLDLGGQIRFGPDVEWVPRPDYRFDDSRRERFAVAIERYFPALDRSRLAPDYVGVRPKISGPGEPQADFRIDGPDVHGIPGLINLLGIESPGLTASLAVAESVLGLVAPERAAAPC